MPAIRGHSYKGRHSRVLHNVLRVFTILLMLGARKTLTIMLDWHPAYYASLCSHENVKNVFLLYIETWQTPQGNHPSIALAWLLGNQFSNNKKTRLSQCSTRVSMVLMLKPNLQVLFHGETPVIANLSWTTQCLSHQPTVFTIIPVWCSILLPHYYAQYNALIMCKTIFEWSDAFLRSRSNLSF